MDLSAVIVGPVVTEKAERLRADNKTYTLRVAPAATKIDVRNALRTHYGVDVMSVRVLHTRPKTRVVGAGTMEKRHTFKKVLVTLAPKSKGLDLTSFQSR